MFPILRHPHQQMLPRFSSDELMKHEQLLCINSFWSPSEHAVQMKGYSVLRAFNSNTSFTGNYKAQGADVELILHLLWATLQ